MTQILLAIQDKNSIDLIKAVCCYKGCKVLVADNSHKLLYFLREEKIDIVFFELSSLYSLAFDMIFSINDFDYERPVILIYEEISLSEEIEFRKRRIFYQAVKPLNSNEIEQVIDAAVNAVSTKMPEKECYTEEKMIAESSINKQRIEKWKQITSKDVFSSVFRIIPNFDRRIISLIHDVEFKYLERYISFAARPTKRIDSLIMKLAQRVL